TGRGLAGVEVRIGDHRRTPSMYTFALPHEPLRAVVTHTDATGRFHCAGLPPGWHRLTASLPGYATLALGELHLEAEGAAQRELLLRLERGFELHGRVVEADGRPVAGAQVQLRKDEVDQLGETGVSSWRHFGQTRSDADGRFLFADLPAVDGGHYTLEA